MSDDITVTLTEDEARIISDLVIDAAEDATNDDDARELSVINVKLGYAPLIDDEDKEEE